MSAWNSVFSFILPTRIVFGPGSIDTLAREMAALNMKRPLIVTDKGIVAAGIVQRAINIMGGCAGVFDGVEANPKDRNVQAGAQAFSDAGADSLIALGGGSPIDCAKAIGVLAANNAKSIKAFEGKDAASKPLAPLIAIPTTAGTGSELTFSSVITDTQSNYKMTVKNAFTAAKTAICDPELTLSVPPMITASTGIDALTHAIEAFTATCAEPLSDAAALYAIELIAQSLLDCCNDASNLAARSRMLMGSMLAGIAFSHSDVAGVHCIAEALGGMYDLPHGMCNAIILPYMMEYCMDYCADKYARVARSMGVTPDKGREGAAAAVNAVKQLANDAGLPVFSSLNVNKSDYAAIAVAAAKNISSGSNPRPMTADDYIQVLNRMG